MSDSDLVPVVVVCDGQRWERVVVGLIDIVELNRKIRSGLHDKLTLASGSRTVLWYTREMGGLDGLAVDGPAGECRLSKALETERNVLNVREVYRMTDRSWEKVKLWKSVG